MTDWTRKKSAKAPTIAKFSMATKRETNLRRMLLRSDPRSVFFPRDVLYAEGGGAGYANSIHGLSVQHCCAPKRCLQNRSIDYELDSFMNF